MSVTMGDSAIGRPVNSPRRVLLASLAGTTIEFFDFYIYATAAVLVFPRLFFPPGDAASATLESLATFALAFFARPVGSAIFGHFGDRVGRKATLIAALLTMGLSTVAIGLLPTYASIGLLAPLGLALCRLGQGIGLGGEWGGAVLLAIENAPPGRRAWYGMFPQLGAPIGFICSSSIFLLLTQTLGDRSFMTWGWRLPFVLSAALVFVGLYVRFKLTETPDFERAIANAERERVPLWSVCTTHARALVVGTFAAVSTFVVFYLMTVFSLTWGTSRLHIPRAEFLALQMIGIVLFGLCIPWSARLAMRRDSRWMLIVATLGVVLFGAAFAPLFGRATPAAVALALSIGLALMGFSYGPLGTALASLFPTAVRYTGVSLTFNLAGIVGASLTPYAATWLAMRFGLASVGLYLSLSGLISLTALALMPASPVDGRQQRTMGDAEERAADSHGARSER
ncbi:MAG TPA: MFS transporter [Steroidobacteraceae bacterium]|nr:MFS transporter [Steroidobacteraceae bacterium]